MKVDRRLIFTLVAMGGTVLTAVLSAKCGMKAERILAECEDRDKLTKLQKVQKTAKIYIPAVASCAGTIIAQEMAHSAGTLAIAASAAVVAGVKDNFERYVNAAKEVVGEAETDIRLKAAEKEREKNVNYETVHMFCINWLGEDRPIYFESTLAQVYDGMAHINRLLFDDNAGGGGIATISDFLIRVDHPEMCIEETDRAGWQAAVLQMDCGAYWVDYDIVQCKGENVYYIKVGLFPNYDILEYLAGMEERGDI